MAQSPSPDGQRPSLGARVAAVLEDLARFVARHGELAVVEAKRSVRGALVGVALAALGVAFVVIASTLLMVALILFISRWMPAWLATLTVMAFWALLAVVLLLLARRQFRRIGFPVTRRTLKEDAAWLATMRRSSER